MSAGLKKASLPSLPLFPPVPALCFFFLAVFVFSFLCIEVRSPLLGKQKLCVLLPGSVPSCIKKKTRRC